MKTTRIFVVFLSLLMLSANCHAAWRDKEGKVLEDTESMKSSGDFGAQLVLIGDEDEFFKRWETPSKDVQINTISQLARGESLIAPVIFSGCYTNEDGKCDVVMDYSVLKPDGTTYAELKDVEVWTDKPAPLDGTLELSVGHIKIVIEPDDLLGTYSVSAKVTDRVLKSSLELNQKFTVMESADIQSGTPKSLSKAEMEELNRWFTYYYKYPQPEFIEEKVKAMVAAGFFDNSNAVAPLIMFFAEVFRQNENLLIKWEKTFVSLPPKYKNYLAYALWQSNTETGKTIVKRWGERDPSIKEIQSNDPFDLKKIPVNSPAILDMFWGSFMASGDTVYVDRIISVLTYPTDLEQQDERLKNLMIVNSAKWSLTSNAFQHDLVYQTCNKYVDSEDHKLREAIIEVLSGADKQRSERGAVN